MRLSERHAYLFRRYLGWFPWQPCFVCQKWYWGGLPGGGWEACFQEFCSTACYEVQAEIDDAIIGGFAPR